MSFYKKLYFVVLIIWLTIKYNLYFLFTGSKKFGVLISRYAKSYTEKAEFETNSLRISKASRKIDLIIDRLPLMKTCLIRSLVKKEYFKLNNIFINVFIGVKRVEDKILAHAWVEPSIYEDKNFRVLHKL